MLLNLLLPAIAVSARVPYAVEPALSHATVVAAVRAGSAAALSSLRPADGGRGLVARCDYHMVRGEWFDYERLWHTAVTVDALVAASELLGNRSDLDAAAAAAGAWWASQAIASPPALRGLVNSTDVLFHGLGCLTDACDGTQDLSDVSDAAYGVFHLCARNATACGAADAAVTSALYQAEHMAVAGEPGMYWSVLNKSSAAPLTTDKRTQIEGSLFLQAAQRTSNEAHKRVLTAAFVAQADATVAYQDEYGLWMMWTPNDNVTGILHPRFNLWYATSLLDAFEATAKNATYLAASLKTALFYATRVQRRDGTVYYDTFVNGSALENDLCGSAVAFLLHLAVRLQPHVDAASRLTLAATARRSASWLLANQYSSAHSDPNLRGAFLELDWRHKDPWYAGPHSRVVIHRDLGTGFALPALSAYARTLKTDEGAPVAPR